jgi:hypothetical protein
MYGQQMATRWVLVAGTLHNQTMRLCFGAETNPALAATGSQMTGKQLFQQQDNELMETQILSCLFAELQ